MKLLNWFTAWLERTIWSGNRVLTDGVGGVNTQSVKKIILTKSWGSYYERSIVVATLGFVGEDNQLSRDIVDLIFHQAKLCSFEQKSSFRVSLYSVLADYFSVFGSLSRSLSVLSSAIKNDLVCEDHRVQIMLFRGLSKHFSEVQMYQANFLREEFIATAMMSLLDDLGVFFSTPSFSEAEVERSPEQVIDLISLVPSSPDARLVRLDLSFKTINLALQMDIRFETVQQYVQAFGFDELSRLFVLLERSVVSEETLQILLENPTAYRAAVCLPESGELSYKTLMGGMKSTTCTPTPSK